MSLLTGTENLSSHLALKLLGSPPTPPTLYGEFRFRLTSRTCRIVPQSRMTGTILWPSGENQTSGNPQQFLLNLEQSSQHFLFLVFQFKCCSATWALGKVNMNCNYHQKAQKSLLTSSYCQLSPDKRQFYDVWTALRLKRRQGSYYTHMKMQKKSVLTPVPQLSSPWQRLMTQSWLYLIDGKAPPSLLCPEASKRA